MRGLLRDGTAVSPQVNLGDIDLRPDADRTLITEKMLAIGGVLEAIPGHLHICGKRAD